MTNNDVLRLTELANDLRRRADEIDKILAAGKESSTTAEGRHPAMGSRLRRGTIVRTTESRNGKDWSSGARLNCMWGVEGVVIDSSDSHGLCYLVRHIEDEGEDGSVAWYDSDEIKQI